MMIDDAVLATNKRFYSAFRDYDQMNAVWTINGQMFCLHPGQEPILARGLIMNSWLQIIINEQLHIAPANEKVVWFGNNAIVVCEEIITGQAKPETMIATNLFVRSYTDLGWSIAGHHSGRKL